MRKLEFSYNGITIIIIEILLACMSYINHMILFILMLLRFQENVLNSSFILFYLWYTYLLEIDKTFYLVVSLGPHAYEFNLG